MSEEKKSPPTKMMPSGNSLFAIVERGPAALKMMRASAGHPDPAHARQEEEVSPGELEAARNQARQRARDANLPVSESGGTLHRGSVVRHIPTGKKVTILSLNASSAEVVSKSGKKWVSKLADLR